MKKLDVINAMQKMVENAAYMFEHSQLSRVEFENTKENAATMYTALINDSLAEADATIEEWAKKGENEAKAEKMKAAQDFWKWTHAAV